jgi:hypothetical protein
MKTLIFLTVILIGLFFVGIRSICKGLLSFLGIILIVSLKPSLGTF